jgi:hypothetical protein
MYPNRNTFYMKQLLLLIILFAGVAVCDTAEKATNTPAVLAETEKAAAPARDPATVEKKAVEQPVAEQPAEAKPVKESGEDEKTPEEKALEDRQYAREDRRNKRSPPVDTYVDREGWQSGVGYRAMEKYVIRLSHLCRERLPGMVAGIAGGKKGILLSVTFKAKRNFYLAQENTKEFLTAIVEDLEKLPEPVAAQVHVTHNGKQIISAIRPRKGKDVKVKYLL